MTWSGASGGSARPRRTDAAGRFALDAYLGDYIVSAEGAGGEFTVAADGPASTVRLAVERCDLCELAADQSRGAARGRGAAARRDVELEPPRAGEVQVRVDAAGRLPQRLPLHDRRPALPAAGRDRARGRRRGRGRGRRRHGCAPGDAVALLWRPRCGRCRYCLDGAARAVPARRGAGATGGLPDDGTTRLRLDGREVHHLMGVSCFAERVVVSEKSVVPVPDGVPPRIAAITGCAVITGVGAVLNVVRRVRRARRCSSWARAASGCPP